MPEQIDPSEYRKVAKFIESTSLKVLATYSDISNPPVLGHLQYFARSTPEARAAERGANLLREQVDEAVAILYALAAAADNRLPVPAVLNVRVWPYIEAFRNQDQEPTNGQSSKERRRRGKQG